VRWSTRENSEAQAATIAARSASLPISGDQEEYDANLVALPVERTEEFLSLLGQK
jgi:hypothetical protein